MLRSPSEHISNLELRWPQVFEFALQLTSSVNSMIASAPRVDKVSITPGTSLGRESPTPSVLAPPRANTSFFMRVLPDLPWSPSQPASRVPSRLISSAFIKSRASALLGRGPCQWNTILTSAAQIVLSFMSLWTEVFERDKSGTMMRPQLPRGYTRNSFNTLKSPSPCFYGGEQATCHGRDYSCCSGCFS